MKTWPVSVMSSMNLRSLPSTILARISGGFFSSAVCARMISRSLSSTSFGTSSFEV